MKIVPIVEGHGDCEAVPVLLRRLVVAAGHHAEIVRPIRIPKSKLLKEAELRRAIQMAAKHAGAGDAILVLLDADADCPATLGPQLRAWARDERKDRRITVVLAQREFEAWFLAATTSLIDARKLPEGTTPPASPESISDAKGWLSSAMGRRYSETIDQPAFAAICDLAAAATCASFAKLQRAVLTMLRDTSEA